MDSRSRGNDDLAKVSEGETMYTTMTVTAISLKPKKWDKDYNAEKLETYFRKAAREQADLILAPEGILEGYVAMDVIRNPERGARWWRSRSR